MKKFKNARDDLIKEGSYIDECQQSPKLQTNMFITSISFKYRCHIRFYTYILYIKMTKFNPIKYSSISRF